MFPNRWNDSRGIRGDKGGNGVRGPGRGVEAFEAAGGPEEVPGDTRPLGAVDMVWRGS